MWSLLASFVVREDAFLEIRLGFPQVMQQARQVSVIRALEVRREFLRTICHPHEMFGEGLVGMG